MASAIGRSAAKSAAAALAPNIYDVRSFGAVPGGGACEAAFNAALAKMDADDPTGRQAKVLYCPGHPGQYSTTYPVFITRSNVTVRGDGRDVSRVGSLGTGAQHPIFVAGLSPNGASGGPLTADHYVDLFGKLDATIAPAGGRAWGLRLQADTIVQFWSSAFDLPRPFGLVSLPGNWRHFRKITINFCLDGRGAPLPDGPFCGIGDAFRGDVSPWRLSLFKTNPLNHNLYIEFCTANAPGTVRQAILPLGDTTGVTSGSVQLDLASASLAGWVGVLGAKPVRVAVAPTSGRGTGNGGLSFTAADNLTFADNEGYPFMVGAWSAQASLRSAGGSGPTMDLSVYGLAVCQDLLYDPAPPVGSAQAVHPVRLAADGPTITDATRYRRDLNSGALIAQLALSNSATTNLARPGLPVGLGGRCVNYSSGLVGGGGGTGIGLFQFCTIGKAQVNLTSPLSGFTVEDVSVSASNFYGDAISTGSMYDVNLRRAALAGCRGLGSIHMGAAYWFTAEDLRVAGSDACIHLYWTWFRSRRLELSGSFNSLAWGQGCHFKMEYGLTGSQVGMYLFRFRGDVYGGDYRIAHFNSDNEGPPYPERASISVGLTVGFATTLTVEECYLGSCDPRAPVLELLGGGAADTVLESRGKSVVSVRAVSCDDGRVWARCDTPLWTGTVEPGFRQDGIDPLEPTTPDGLLGLTFRTDDHPCPPGARSWTPNCLVEPPVPARGLHRRYRPAVAGRYGTALPPVWEGEGLVSSTGAELGAFSTHSATALATISAAPYGGTVAATLAAEWGMFGTAARHRMLDYWLRGWAAPAVATPPSALSLGLSTAYRAPGPDTYDLAVTGAFAAASARLTTNPAAINFAPPSFTPTLRYLSVVLKDQAGSAIWASRVPWAAPFTIAPAVSIAPGGIVVTGSAPTGTSPPGLFDRSTGGFTTYVWNAILDFFHRFIAMPIPPALCLGLSTDLANREGTVAEPSGSGYARVVLAPTTPYSPTSRPAQDPAAGDVAMAGRGRSLLASTKSFPAATGSDWPEVRSVFLADAPSGGTVLWHANLVMPRTARAGGPALAFAPGALIFVL